MANSGQNDGVKLPDTNCIQMQSFYLVAPAVVIVVKIRFSQQWISIVASDWLATVLRTNQNPFLKMLVD